MEWWTDVSWAKSVLFSDFTWEKTTHFHLEIQTSTSALAKPGPTTLVLSPKISTASSSGFTFYKDSLIILQSSLSLTMTLAFWLMTDSCSMRLIWNTSHVLVDLYEAVCKIQLPIFSVDVIRWQSGTFVFSRLLFFFRLHLAIQYKLALNSLCSAG